MCVAVSSFVTAIRSYFVVGSSEILSKIHLCCVESSRAVLRLHTHYHLNQMAQS